MEIKNSLFKLSGHIQHYQWGGFEYIPQLTGVPNKEHQPFAEYWLGAHDNAASQLEGNGALNDFIRQHPGTLGEQVLQQFGKLPYLLKVLDVRNMLSIQVHPNKKSATLEFARENATDIPLMDPARNYKDDNHKPELIMALGPFWLLHGFREPAGLKKIIAAIPEFAFMLPLFEQKGYKGLYAYLMLMEQPKVNEILQPLLNRLIPQYQSGSLNKDDPGFWAARAALQYNEPGKTDRGIFSIYLLNLVQLQKGEAVFQDAGILHAYLEGQNVEIMANSDNVLRGGLTPKHIDVPELLKHVIFESPEPVIIKGEMVTGSETVFVTPAPDFELSRISLPPGEGYSVTAATAEIFLVLQGAVEVTVPGKTLIVERGEAFILFYETRAMFRTINGAEIYRATVPSGSYQ